MTRRYSSGFDILGLDSDPTPGDPDAILNQIVPTYTSLGNDAQDAFNALKDNAIESGTGKTMAALQKLIGTEYPSKLRTAASSFLEAATIYQAYGQALAQAQTQVDQAMDQATPIAGLANTTVPPAPADASPEQLSATQSQQQNVDEAKSQLTAAQRLAQDAKDLRDQAGSTFSKNLGSVSVVPARSAFQKFLDFFEHNPLIQILLDIAVAIVGIFVPVVALALGAALFGAETALNTIANGKLDVGALVVGLFALGLGGGGALLKLSDAAGGLIGGLGSKLGGLVTKIPGGIGSGISGLTKTVQGSAALGKAVSIGAGTVVTFGEDAAENAVEDAIDHEPIDAAVVFGSAAVAAGVGAAFSVGGAAFGSRGSTAGPADPDEPAVPDDPADPDEPAAPDEPAGSDEPAAPDDPADSNEPAVPDQSGAPGITVTPPTDSPATGNAVPIPGDGENLQPPPADTRPDGEADSAAGLAPTTVSVPSSSVPSPIGDADRGGSDSSSTGSAPPAPDPVPSSSVPSPIGDADRSGSDLSSTGSAPENGGTGSDAGSTVAPPVPPAADTGASLGQRIAGQADQVAQQAGEAISGVGIEEDQGEESDSLGQAAASSATGALPFIAGGELGGEFQDKVFG